MPDSPSRRAALIDNPINSHDEDFLELDGFAEALGQFIDTCDTPVTIGIQGDWGIGKTSLLNLLHHKHLKGPRRGGHPTPHIYINTWSYAQFKQEEWLGILILNGIVDELERKFPEVSTRAQAVRSVAQSIGKFALGATNQLVAKQVGINVDAGLKAASTPSASKIPQMSALLREYEEKFAVLVSAVAKGERDRLVVMIDDLDRVSPIRALELLEAIKNFLHVDRCVFVLAVDYEVIQQGVLQRLGPEAQRLHGKSYFDKIIQIPFNMPTTAYRLDRYILALLGWDLSGADSKVCSCGEMPFLPAPTADARGDAEFFLSVTGLTVGHNPRSIKRVAAYVRLLQGVRNKRVSLRNVGRGRGSGDRWNIQSAKLLYAFACLQMEWPEVFQHFVLNPSPAALSQYKDWDFLASLPEVRRMLDRYPDPDQLRSNISGFFDEILMLIDTDEDNVITVEEYKPVWDILRDAGLTNVEITSSDQLWAPLEELLPDHAHAHPWIADFMEVLRRSSLSNLRQCRALKAGKSIVDILWDHRRLGSFVCTQSDPLRLHVEVAGDALASMTERFEPGLLTPTGGRHWGSGNTRVDLQLLVQQARPVAVLDDLLRALLAQGRGSQTPLPTTGETALTGSST